MLASASERTRLFALQMCEDVERVKNVAKLRRRRDGSFHARGFSMIETSKIEQKSFDSEAYFRIAHLKTEPEVRIDVSLESMITDVSGPTTIRRVCVSRGKADASSRSVGIFERNRIGFVSPSWSLVQLKLRTSVKRMDLGAAALFGPLLPSRAINTLLEEKK